MGERTCVVCGAGLSGRQSRFCGKACKSKADTAAARTRPGYADRKASYQRAWRDRVGISSTSICPTKTCERCGRSGVGYAARFCSRGCAGEARSAIAATSCATCGAEIPSKRKYCSVQCRGEQRSPLRVAVEATDWESVAEILLERTKPSGRCRLWSGRARASKSGGSAYGYVNAGKRWPVHRLMALATRGGVSLGHMPVHHVCGNSLCVEPSHLQVVTPAENTAEMLERTHYKARIASLEQALAAVSPRHPLLSN